MKSLVTILIIGLLFMSNYANDREIVQSILDENDLSWDIDEIATFQNERIVSLNLSNKQISKEGLTVLSPEIGKLSELRKLYLNDNDLLEIPVELFSLKKLVILEIKNNSLLSLPSGLEKLTNLIELDLRNNELDFLPPAVGNLKTLKKLHLWGNRFQQLPSEIGKLISLQELYLSGNRLETLPLSITRLKVKYLDVINNKLCNTAKPVDKWLKKFDHQYKSVQYCGDNRSVL